MGAACSSSLSNAAKQELPQQPSGKTSVPKLDSIDSLRGIFPQWDEVSLRGVMLKCEGSPDQAVDLLLTWGSEDNVKQQKHPKLTKCSPSTPVIVLPRQGYDVFMRSHLLRHTTPASNILSIQAAAKFISQARLAKKVVAQRRADSGCESAVALLSDKVTENRMSSDTTCTSPREDKILDGLQLMKERLDFLNLRMVTMEDDGNCQFRAISYELYGSQSYHYIVRDKVIQHLRSNSDTFSFYVGEESDWIQYLKKMSMDRTWGDELTITAASQVFAVNIHVITTEKSNWLLHYGTDDGGDKGGGDPADSSERESATGKTRDVFLLYISPIHYNVVAPPQPGSKK